MVTNEKLLDGDFFKKPAKKAFSKMLFSRVFLKSVSICLVDRRFRVVQRGL